VGLFEVGGLVLGLFPRFVLREDDLFVLASVLL
jgi:hypothetical protein